jgi:hypothetical protein
MTITIGNVSFDGPFTGASELLPRSGVYAILGRGVTGGNWIVVDIGESGDVRSRVENHHATLSVAALYCDEATRMVVEQTLRLQYNPASGDR